MKTIHLIFIVALMLLIVFQSCRNEGDPPTVSILFPESDATIEYGDTVQIMIQADDPDNDLSQVRLYINMAKVYSSGLPPFEYCWYTDEEEPGDKNIIAVAEDRYGNTTLSQVLIHLNATEPYIRLDSVSNILPNSASFTYTILNTGGKDIITSGICLNTRDSPDTSNIAFHTNANDASVSGSLSDLIHQTGYYIRAFAYNETGIAYSNELNFNTPECYLPEVHIDNIRDIRSTSAQVEWSFSEEYGMDILLCGICWAAAPSPTIVNSSLLTFSDHNPGNYTDKIAELESSTTYYVRAFARTDCGTAYSNEMSFSTLRPDSLEFVLLFNDDFEDYTTGIHPENWITRFEGAYSMISEDVAYEGGKSFMLISYGSWVSVEAFPLDSVPLQIIYEGAVYINQSDKGYVIGFGFKENDNTYRYLNAVRFNNNGKINIGYDIQNWLPQTWYKIRVACDFSMQTGKLWINDILSPNNITLSNQDEIQDFVLGGINFLSSTSEAYFDNIKIYIKREY